MELTRAEEQTIKVTKGAGAIDVGEKGAVESFTDGRYHLEIEEYMKRAPESWVREWAGREISRQDWIPKSVVDIDDAMYDFIDSTIPMFCKMVPYKPFWLYIKQMQDWMSDTTDINLLDTVDEIEAYKDREIDRMDQNLLYGMNKYIWREEAEAPGGRVRYKASTPQALLVYIMDAGYSTLAGKGRQAAKTTTAGGAALLRSMVKTNMRIVIAADDKETTGNNIFATKIKYPFTNMPPWMKPDLVPSSSSTELKFDFAPGATKGDRGQMTSTFSLMASVETTAINGMTPSWMLLDEAGDMKTFSKLVLEGEPTMIGLDETPGSPTFGKLIRKRQIIAWTTGTSSSRGDGQFEGAYKTLLENWRRRKNTRGWVPLFFDWTCRRGATDQWYNDLRQQYLEGSVSETKGLSADDALSMFSAHYPSSPDDMFMVSHKTIIPVDIIDRNMTMCLSLPQNQRPIRGRFVPQWDNTPMPDGSPIPHRPIGVTFVPDPYDNPDSPVELYLWPNNNTRNRYWQGTDPINADDGKSKMASAIYDCVGITGESGEARPTIACIVNGRTHPLSEIYLQTKLMGMFYRGAGQRACKELVEVNQGHKYLSFVQEWLKMEGTLVYQKELDPMYRGGGHIFGVDLKSTRKSVLLRDVVDLIDKCENRIRHYGFWSQLRTISVERGKSDQPEWGTIDSKRYNDDIPIACAWAYVCRMSFSHLRPEVIEGESAKFRNRRVWVEGPNGQIRQGVQRIPIHV